MPALFSFAWHANSAMNACAQLRYYGAGAAGS